MKSKRHDLLTYALDLGAGIAAPFVAAHRKVIGQANDARESVFRKKPHSVNAQSFPGCGNGGDEFPRRSNDLKPPYSDRSSTVKPPYSDRRSAVNVPYAGVTRPYSDRSSTVKPPYSDRSSTVKPPYSGRSYAVVPPSSDRKSRTSDPFTGASAAQKRKIQSILDFSPQSNLFSKARYPRIARNRWLESSVEEFPSVHITGQRLQAVEDDRAINLKIDALKVEFLNKIKDLRAAVKGKLKVEVRQLDSLGSCRVVLKTLQGKTISDPDGNTLRGLSIRGGGMELRHALELSGSLRTLHKQCLALSKSITRAHSDLTTVVGKHRRRGSTELIFTDKIFKQINSLRVLPVAQPDDGAYCPTPFLQMESFRMHASLMARAIAGHLTLINRLYNRRTNLKRRAVGTTRPASFGLATGRFTYFSMPLLEWRISLRLKDGRQILRDSVQRTTYSKVRGRMLLEKTEQVSTPDGSLSMPAVAYASLLHMADEYHCVEAARFAFTQVVSTVIDNARTFMSTRSNCAAYRGDWSFSEQVITPNQLQIPTYSSA